MIRRPPRSTLFSLRDALPISTPSRLGLNPKTELQSTLGLLPWVPNLFIKRRIHAESWLWASRHGRSEEHTSELQSRPHLVCRLLLEKKNKQQHTTTKNKQVTT